MQKSASKHRYRLSDFHPKGIEASRVRQRKHALARELGIPEDLIAGSLTLTHRKCGKPTCRCASDRGHSMWTLTYSVAGDKHVLVIPEDWLPWLRPLVIAGRRYRQAVAEVVALNAHLLALWRRQNAGRKPRRHSGRA